MHVLLRGPATAILLFATSLAVTASCSKDSPVAPSPSCTFAVSPAGATLPPTGGSTTLHVSTAATCAWTARAESAWLTVSPGGGTGPADVTVTAAANEATDPRTGRVIVAERDLSISQEGRAPAVCEYLVDPERETFEAEAGRARINVQTGPECSWTARAMAQWVTITRGSGTGPGIVEYEVPEFTGSQARETQIVIGDRSVLVHQDPPVPEACAYGVDIVNATLHWHGGGVDVTLTTGERCRWTAETDAPWLQLTTPAAGEGPTVVSVRTDSFTQDATRASALMLRWPTATAGQNVWVTQEGCRYSITAGASASFTAAGGTGDAYVIEQALSPSCNIPCSWTAVPTVPWIRILSGSPNAGYDRFRYEVLANTTGASRIGTIVVMGHVVTVTQGG